MNHVLQSGLIAAGLSIASNVDAVDGGSRTAAFLAGFDQAGRHFEKNLGQLPSSAAFAFRATDYRFDLVEDGIELNLEGNRMLLGDPMRIRFHGCNPACPVEGVEELPFTLMYRISRGGNRKIMTSIPTYASVACRDLYDGIDLRYRVVDGQVEYDFLLEPGADPRRIEIAISGARQIRSTDEGDLRLTFALCEVIQHRPVAYQRVEGTRRPVSAEYRRLDGDRIGIQLGPYDPGAPLVIDPLLSVHVPP